MIEDALYHMLQEATQGLLFPSETDAPLVPFVFPLTAHVRDLQRVQDLLGIERGHFVEQTTLTRFFRPVVVSGYGKNPETTARFCLLARVLKENLRTLKVWRVGKMDLDVYVVGRSAQGNLAGVRTRVVET